MRLGIVGPRSLVGEELVRLLEKRAWVREVSFISTQNAPAGFIPFRGRKTKILPSAKASQDRFDLLLSAADARWSKAYLKRFFGKASFIIDESSAFRLSDDVPLVV